MLPKNPNIAAKKATSKKAADKMASKQPGKVAAKSGVKESFSKPRKAPLTKKKPKTWTQEEWEVECV
jgi:hypothetical protein